MRFCRAPWKLILRFPSSEIWSMIFAFFYLISLIGPPSHRHATTTAGLRIDSCNIYGQMYRVGRIIDELSGPCVECKCTEIGVNCVNLKCWNDANHPADDPMSCRKILHTHSVRDAVHSSFNRRLFLLIGWCHNTLPIQYIYSTRRVSTVFIHLIDILLEFFQQLNSISYGGFLNIFYYFLPVCIHCVKAYFDVNERKVAVWFPMIFIWFFLLLLSLLSRWRCRRWLAVLVGRSSALIEWIRYIHLLGSIWWNTKTMQ